MPLFDLEKIIDGTFLNFLVISPWKFCAPTSPNGKISSEGLCFMLGIFYDFILQYIASKTARNK
jgi:hypothetical protein